MASRRISDEQRWQIIGMTSAGMSYKTICRQLGSHYTLSAVWSENMFVTQNVKDRPRFGRPSVQPNVKIRVLVDLSDDIRLQQASVLKGIGYLSTLVDRNQRERLVYCRTRLNWKL